jgi:ribose 5-phosphate isomerase RpiB
MIVTARQLEDLHRQNGANGHVTLPYRARLSPLASDWVRAKKIAVGYADLTATAAASAKLQASEPTRAAAPPLAASQPARAGAIVWWCDGPCGPAKAAVIAVEKESALRPLDIATDPRQLVIVVKQIARDVKSGTIDGAILLVQNGALATIYANRCPSLRAILGTCMEAVEQGVQLAASNVLIVEHPYKTLQQVKNMLSRFVRGKRVLSDEVKRQLQEMAS